MSLLLLALLQLGGGAAPGPTSDDLVSVEVATVGVDLQSGSPIALLRDQEWGQLLPIWIGTEEARAIARVIQGVETPRPMTHDLLATIIGAMGGTVEEVVVHGLREGTYLGRIRVRTGRGGSARTRDIDSRPSDALNVALRTGAPIRVAAALVRDAPEVDFVAFEGQAEVVRSMGMTVGRPTRELRRRYGLPDREGVVILNVSSELEEMGLQRGDLLVDVNGSVPGVPMDFLHSLGDVRPSETVRIVYVREGREHLMEIPPGRAGRPSGPGRRA